MPSTLSAVLRDVARPLAGLAAALLVTTGLGVGLLATTGVAAAAPQSRALLVGVSDYPKEAVGDLQLAGPKNDVALMIDTLVRLGVPAKNTIVLADGLEGTTAGRPADGMPTRGAILGALDRLAAEAGPGDFVLVYLSGHGSQQPMVDAARHEVAKADGLEEIFLPIDIGPWEDSVGAVKNALVDWELGRAVTAIRAKGARVWVVVDACHSGTMTRAGADAVAKQVPASVLHIPEEALARARASAVAKTAAATRGAASGGRPRPAGWGFGAVVGEAAKPVTPPPAPAAPSTTPTIAPAATPAATPAKVAPGGYVGFFAAWPDQVALQKALPRGYGAGERRPQGVLTFYLAQALRSGRVSTFRDVAHRVMAGYDQFGQAPTPMFEGDLSADVPGGAGSSVLRWPVEADGKTLKVGAGIVDGLGVGAVVALAVADAPETPRAFARVAEAGPARAWLEPIERGGMRFDPALARESLLATLIERNADFQLSVARPPKRADTATTAIAAALDTLAAEPETVVRLVEPNEPADLRLFVEAGRLWLVSEGAELVTSGRDRSPSLPLEGTASAETVGAVKRALAGFAKARNLVRIAGVVGAGPLGGSLTVEPFLVRDEGSAPAGAAAPDDRPCAELKLDRLPETAKPIGDALPDLGHCDALYFRLSNGGAKPIDVTPLYVDGVGGIAYMGPPEGLRLEPGVAGRLVPLRIVTWSRRSKAPLPIGRERLLFVAVEVEGRTALPADFRYLAQAAPTTGSTRGGSAPGTFRGLLERAAFGGPGTRGATAPTALGAAGIVDFGWRVVAPEGAK
jgi:hypothetical protein